MPWYKKELSSDDIAAGQGVKLIEDFTVIYMSSGSPKAAALLRAVDFQRNEYYLSPSAVNIAMPLIRSQGWFECPAPESWAVIHIAGQPDLTRIPFAKE